MSHRIPGGSLTRTKEESSSDSESEEGDLDQSFQHQESEIKEEVFTPHLKAVEQVRLKEIVRTRSLLRETQPQISDYQEIADEEDDDVDGDQGFISRHQIQALHHQLSQDLLSKATKPTITMETPTITMEQQQQPSGGHDYINQAMVDMVLNDGEEACEASATELSVTVGEDPLQRVPSSNGYSSQGNPSVRKARCSEQRNQPIAVLEQDNLGEFEKRLLLAKQKNKPTMPDLFQIPWYHPGISRHVAECLLVHKDIRDGTFLLRDCVADPHTVTLSVRCQKSVKHYKVVWDGKQFLFGLGKFNSLDEFKTHFIHQPVISGDSGVLVQLKYPYPRGVSEPAIYLDANVLTDVDPAEFEAMQKPSTKASKATKFTNSLDFSINSKEGYLTKMGFHRKNWKKRWFVLYRNEFKYFSYCGDKEPLRVINLDEVTSIDRDDSTGKNNCFRLVTSYRTFFMYATSEVEANEWVQIIDWKLKQQSRR